MPQTHHYEYLLTFAHFDKLLRRTESTLTYSTTLDVWEENQVSLFWFDAERRMLEYLRENRLIEIGYYETHLRTSHPLDHPAVLELLKQARDTYNRDRLLRSVTDARLAYPQ